MGASAAAVEIIVLNEEERNSYSDNFIVLGVEKTVSRYLILLFSCDPPPPPPCRLQGCGSGFFGRIRFRCHVKRCGSVSQKASAVFLSGRVRYLFKGSDPDMVLVKDLIRIHSFSGSDPDPVNLTSDPQLYLLSLLFGMIQGRIFLLQHGP